MNVSLFIKQSSVNKWEDSSLISDENKESKVNLASAVINFVLQIHIDYFEYFDKKRMKYHDKVCYYKSVRL